MLPFYFKIEDSARTKVTGLGLCVFRIFISAILLVEVGKLFYFRHLYFDPIPYLVESQLSFSLVLLAWMGVLAFGLLAGFKTRAAALINYVLVLVFFSSFTTLKYHFDAALIGISFLLLLLPVNTRLSIDSLFYKFRVMNEQEQKVRKVYYYLPVLLVLCLQYFDSFFHKSVSTSWIKGLGVWLPASLPDQVYTNQSWLLNQKEIVLALGYIVLLFEFGFIFLLLIKKFRVWLVLIGVSMHLAIAFVFPIPTFGVTFAGIYMLLLPVKFWGRLGKAPKVNSKPVLAFSEENIMTHRLILFIQHFDVLGKLSYAPSVQPVAYRLNDGNRQVQGLNAIKSAMYKTVILAPLAALMHFSWVREAGKRMLSLIPLKPQEQQDQSQREALKVKLIYCFVLYLVFAQLIKTLNSPLVTKVTDAVGVAPVRRSLEMLLFPAAVVNTKLLGITENLVYTGFEEDTYEVLGIQYITQGGAHVWLPIVEPNGMASPMHFGRVGAVTIPNSEQSIYRSLVGVTSFWATKHGVSLGDARFRILSKPISIQLTWEKDFLNKQLSRPWQEAGELVWKNNKPYLHMK